MVGAYKVYMLTDVLGHQLTAIADQTYPSRIIWKIVDEMKVLAKRKYEGLSPDKTRTELRILLTKYKQAAEVDKLFAANVKTDEVKVQLQDNMTDLLKNQTDIEVKSLSTSAPRSTPTT